MIRLIYNLRGRSLLEGVAVEEHHCLLSLWCQEEVGEDKVIVVVCQRGFVPFGFFFLV